MVSFDLCFSFFSQLLGLLSFSSFYSSFTFSSLSPVGLVLANREESEYSGWAECYWLSKRLMMAPHLFIPWDSSPDRSGYSYYPRPHSNRSSHLEEFGNMSLSFPPCSIIIHLQMLRVNPCLHDSADWRKMIEISAFVQLSISWCFFRASRIWLTCPFHKLTSRILCNSSHLAKLRFSERWRTSSQSLEEIKRWSTLSQFFILALICHHYLSQRYLVSQSLKLLSIHPFPLSPI